MSKNVVAVVSNLPIAELETARLEHKFLAALVNKRVVVRYRGPRRKGRSGRTSFEGQFTCLKQDARTFSIYYR